MPFAHPPDKSAPETNPELLWPIHGLAYVIAYIGPMSAGLIVGILLRNWRAALLGLATGMGIAILNTWLCDRFLERRIVAIQGRLQTGAPRVLVNLVAFAGAAALCALSMLAPIVLLGRATLAHIR